MLPDYENSFEPVWYQHNPDNETYDQYREDVYQFSAQDCGEFPFNAGNFLFYKMDKENHDY